MATLALLLAIPATLFTIAEVKNYLAFCQVIENNLGKRYE